MTDEPKGPIEETKDESISSNTQEKSKNTGESETVNTDDDSLNEENICTNCQTIFTITSPGCLAGSGGCAIWLLCLVLFLFDFVLIFSGGWVAAIVIGFLILTPLMKIANKLLASSEICPACGSTEIIPTETPRAQKLIRETTVSGEDSEYRTQEENDVVVSATHNKGDHE